MKNVKDRGQQLRKALDAINSKHKGLLFREIRGRGLMIGAELHAQWAGKAGDIGEIARKHGVLVLQAGPNVLRFLPPLIITAKELQVGLSRLEKAISAFVASNQA
jgi:acetylornithine/N-succinyldiaminopimelate aminotransferase